MIAVCVKCGRRFIAEGFQTIRKLCAWCSRKGYDA